MVYDRVNEDQDRAIARRRRVAAAALEVMEEAFNVPMHRLTMASRQRAHIAFARQIAMYLAHVVGQLSLREVAAAFDREPSTVSHACHAIEDRRDSAIFDGQMAFLEDTLRTKINDPDAERWDDAGCGPAGLELKQARLVAAG